MLLKVIYYSVVTLSMQKQIAEKRREAKGKGEKGKTYPLERRVSKNSKESKKAFLSDQCKETKENNSMGKTRDLFKKRDTKGVFHEKMGTIRERNGMDLTEAEDIKKRWQEYTKNYIKKLFMTQIITIS